MKNTSLIVLVAVVMLSALTGCSSKQTVSASTIREVHVAADIPISYTPKEEPVKYNNETRKVVYLTFDDGPGIYTPQVLDILNQNHIHATFFLVGPHAQQYPKFVSLELQEGDYVG
ncbi:polysaccharide deacetylase family protein, partial [Ectobacillus funiculus]